MLLILVANCGTICENLEAENVFLFLSDKFSKPTFDRLSLIPPKVCNP